IEAASGKTNLASWVPGSVYTEQSGGPTWLRSKGDSGVRERHVVYARRERHRGRVRWLDRQSFVAHARAGRGAVLQCCASPVIENDLVITHPGNYEPLTAFDSKNGAVRWTAGDGGFFAAPLVADIGGVRQVITVTQSNVIGVAVADGTVLWRFP